MKLEDVIKKNEERIESLNKDSIGFVILSNKGDYHSRYIHGDFNTETLISMGQSIIESALKEISEEDVSKIKMHLLMRFMDMPKEEKNETRRSNKTN